MIPVFLQLAFMTILESLSEFSIRLRLRFDFSGNVKQEHSLYYVEIVNSGVAQSCLTLCDPMDCSLPHSFVYGIFQAIVLEWIAISFSRGFSRPRDRTQVSRIVDRRFTL